ncbi:carbamoyl phosphate synthase-like protein [compost metagenome]
MWAVYLPCIFYYVWISLKSRSFGFFKAVNPALPYGGMTLENKNFINQIIPENYRAKSLLLDKKSQKKALSFIEENSIKYPVVLKPNNGCRGRGVEIIYNSEQLVKYFQNCHDEDILLEEYIDFPNEIGVFYIRLPNKKRGFISGIVGKKGIEVSGTGDKSLKELVKLDLRYHKFYPSVFENEIFDENTVPTKDEKILLSSIGNHARGATFYDVSENITAPLELMFNELCSKFDGFYYGRFDVKFNNWEELEKGKNFKIIELNGAASEPTFIYDPKNSYFVAVKEIIRHWNYMYRIAKVNNQKGHQFTDINECWSIFRKFNPFSI